MRPAGVAELVDATDLKSVGAKALCRFESGRPHQTQQYVRNQRHDSGKLPPFALKGESRMDIKLVSCVLAGTLLLATIAYGGNNTPLKPGLWRVTMTGPSMAAPSIAFEMCMDHATERSQLALESMPGREQCSRHDTAFTPTSATVDTVCSLEGTTFTSHRVVTYVGDRAYTVKARFVRTPPDGKSVADSLSMEGRWLGPCPSTMKPGDRRQLSAAAPAPTEECLTSIEGTSGARGDRSASRC